MPSEVGRREFLKNVFLGACAAVAGLASQVFPSKPEDELVQERGAHRWGMVIDLDRCTGCQACVVACSVENNQMLGSPEEAAMGRIIRWLKILPKTEVEGARIRQSLIPMPCQQCEDPPCTRVCPTSATFMNP
ncbi:MAG: 4Fe-4S dicluster domain-containing protein, partial [Elusimicrobia bacterium]|nr:4Fe-4S dicluster domain-containing protein [Elusimicrobiota bacterium]